MAIYHCNATTISRSSGRSACAAAAYRAGEKIIDERTGLIHDFTRKGGVLHSEIVAPVGASTWATNRAKLWNRAEQAEDKSTRRASATTAREFNIALPHELDREAQIASCQEFAQYIVDTYSVAVDFSIHEPSKEGDNRNRHVHFMLTDRRITESGFAAKVRELNIFGGGKANIVTIRERWAKIANCFLERGGIHEGIDHRSYKSQGINREATTHLGVIATALERRGVATERGDRNRTAQKINELREELEDAGETMRALELAETYEGKDADEIEAVEETNSASMIGLVTARSSFLAHDVDAGIRGVVADLRQILEPTPCSESVVGSLPEQHKLDQQQAAETSKLVVPKMTQKERIKVAQEKAKAAQELRRILERGRPRLGHGRDRDRDR